MALEPRPLDDFWADLTSRRQAYREVDGPVVAQAQINPDRDHHEVTVLLEGEVLEIYVDASSALSHRISRDLPLLPVAFTVDGEVLIEFKCLQKESS